MVFHGLLVIMGVLVCGCIGGLVRGPKIYNALITSDANLTPSQAFPIIEPVLRTTALGVAFPPIVVHPPPRRTIQPTQLDKETAQSDGGGKVQFAYHGSLYPLAYDPYIPYGYRQEYLYPALPYYQHPIYVEPQQQTVKEESPKPAINFKKNPDIPDVLPPFPIKDERKGNS
ncbi:PREDICTED: uncharacterized protein LOC108558902 [Nicrophorus vespilloides]|uniref:Uncharacterized protein LOC108558902 n=1 Tax=Nicrophorus vespilloides TaxID=110193 RepID=A0ABM1MA47_NICVS|nr:PREDICTED: uncharacterized protein LOC108558902 [Nicrophorus vespilloides]XP_017771448.1 PREDICTED: uncharacterized protein LOC108558902 [Nicrophorus vespilloides]